MTEGETKRAIEDHLWQAIDLMAATLVKPDPRIWDVLLIYRPKDHANAEIDIGGDVG